MNRLLTQSEINVNRFATDGFLGPVQFFTPAECKLIAAQLRLKAADPLVWLKGNAASSHFMYSIATRPNLIASLIPLLGENIILWGASVIRRVPGQIHYWHSDAESCDARGGFVSIWIGLENTSDESSLQVIPGSHEYGLPIQEAAVTMQQDRHIESGLALDLARRHDPKAELRQPPAGDGEGIIFDGRLWHGSHNTQPKHIRRALLFQYATGDARVRIPDLQTTGWPIPMLEEPLPPVIAVSGQASESTNHVVQPPNPGEGYLPLLTTVIKPLQLPLLDAEPKQNGRSHYPVLAGTSATIQEMKSHASVLGAGMCPHPPHIHPEEELLILLDGEADIVLADDADRTNEKKIRLKPGSFSYYPSGQYHTIENPTASPITYLMFKWRVRRGSKSSYALQTRIVEYGNVFDRANLKVRQTRLLFEKPTVHLAGLHAHVTHMPPGFGYEPHEDGYDVAIVMLSGEVETLGRMIRAHDIAYYSAFTSHGLKNTGTEPARYLVFEFHTDRKEIQRRREKRQQKNLENARKRQELEARKATQSEKPT